MYILKIDIEQYWTYMIYILDIFETDVDVEKPRRSYFLAAILRQGASKKTNGQLFPFLEESFRGWKLICNLYCLDKQPLSLAQWPFQEPKLEVPTIYKAYFWGLNFREYPQKILPYMVLTYLHSRILKFPLIGCPRSILIWWHRRIACGKRQEYLGKHRIEVPRPQKDCGCLFPLLLLQWSNGFVSGKTCRKPWCLPIFTHKSIGLLQIFPSTSNQSCQRLIF